MEPAKYCIKCGKPLPPEAKHCPNCGADVADLHPTPSDEVQETTSAPPTQEFPPQSVSTGSYHATLTPSPDVPASHLAQTAPYGGPGAAPRSPYASAPPAPAYPQETAAEGLQRTRAATSPKRLSGGFIAILGGVAMLVAQGFSMSKGYSLNLLGVGLGVLCLASGIIALVMRGWGWVILGALLSCGVFVLCGLELYQKVQWIRTVPTAEATAWTLQNGGIIWLGGIMLGMIAFSKAFQSLFRRR